MTSWLTNMLVWALAAGQPGAAAPRPEKTVVAQTAPAKPVPTKPAAAPAPAAAKLSLEQIVERVQARYDKTQSYRAKFQQAQLNATFGRTRKSSGEVRFKKPGLMRWDYQSPEKKMFVSDGRVLWLYEPADNQAFKQALTESQLPAALAFLMGKGKMKDEFDISFAQNLNYGRAQDYRLSLKPKKPQAQYKSIYFIVDPETFEVRQTILVDAQGNINDVTFTDVSWNTPLPDTTFKWKPPAGVRVVDTAAMGAKLGR